MHREFKTRKVFYHTIMCCVSFLMLYPLLWMVFSSFKEENDILLTAKTLIPRKATLVHYIEGWKVFFQRLLSKFLFSGDSSCDRDDGFLYNCSLRICTNPFSIERVLVRIDDRQYVPSGDGIEDSAVSFF